MSTKNVKFSDILRACVETGLRNVLGEGSMHSVLFYLQLDQLEQNPRELHNKLYSIFKDGAVILEKVVVKELYQRLDMLYVEREAFDFEEYVKSAERMFVIRAK
jgi:hypothetical protein